MEDILDIYAMPYNKDIPVICMDEKPYMLIGDVRDEIPMKPKKLRKYDFEYSKHGSCSIFIFTEPHKGWRHVNATQRRTKQDWAKQIHKLLTIHYPDKEKIILVMDNLNTHAISSLYDTFPPETARQLARRLEIHYTPRHGSWLNVAEIELTALEKQCLANRRINNLPNLNTELSVWEQKRNSETKKVKWLFTTNDARTKLLRLYPEIYH